jgi:sugar O-acyltransferase (sialic acid O-acetyltransferase NeuD family)
VFFDNVNDEYDQNLSNHIILKTAKELKKYFETVSNKFCLGVGMPEGRKSLMLLGISLGGELQSIISSRTMIGGFGTEIEGGVTILSGVTITASVKVKLGTLINKDCILSHDVIVGEFVEISPGARILGGVSIGSHTSIGTNAVVLPGIIIGKNCVIGAGSVVTKNVIDGVKVMGIPAK